jgi:O-antigen/teichoic acid export membrane protein
MDRDDSAGVQVGAIAPSPQESAAEGILRTGSSAFFANAAVTLVGIGAGAVLMMVNEVLAARFLGPAGYGLYALALMLARISAVMAVFGVPVSVLHHLPVQLSRGERHRALGTILGSMPLPLVFGLTLALGLGIGADWIASRVLGQPEAGPFLAVLGFAIPLFVVIDLLGIIVRGFGRALPAVVIQNMVPQLCSIGVLAFLLASDGPPIGAAYAQLGGLVVSVPLGIWFVVRLVRDHIGSVKPAFELGRLYGYALPITFNVIASLVIGLTDLFLLGLFTDASTVGTYRACMQIVLVFGLPMNALRAATAPVYTVLIADQRQAALQTTYAAAVRLATFMAVPLLVLIVINGGDLLGIMGPAFIVGASALLVLACGQAVESAFSASHVVLMIGSRQRLEAVNMAVAACLNLVLNLLLIPSYGLLGAALSTTTALIALAVLRAVQVRRIFALHTFDRPLLRIPLVAVPPALLIWVVSLPLGLAPGSGYGALAFRVVSMAVLIGIGLWRFGLDAQDRAMARSLVLKRFAAPARRGAAPSGH